MTLLLLAQTSQPSVSQWVTDFTAVFGYVWSVIGGVAGIAAFVLFLKQQGIIGRVREQVATQGQVQVQQHEKINEVAEKNPANVDPLPPMPICPPLDKDSK